MTLKKVLVVDDDDVVREMAVTTLEGRGYGVITAEGVDDAMRVARENQGGIAVLVTDLDMRSRGNGLDLVRQFRREYPGSDTTIYLMCAGSGAVRGQALEAGVEAVVEKPFDPYDLRRLVERHLI